MKFIKHKVLVGFCMKLKDAEESKAVAEDTVRIFFKAIEENNLEAVKTMLAADPRLLNIKKDNVTPLIFAIGHSNFTIALHLIDEGADVNVKSSRGKSPLALALICSIDLADKILNRGDLNPEDGNLLIGSAFLESPILPSILDRMVEKFDRPLKDLLALTSYDMLVKFKIIKSPQEAKAVAAVEGGREVGDQSSSNGASESLLKALESFEGPSLGDFPPCSQEEIPLNVHEEMPADGDDGSKAAAEDTVGIFFKAIEKNDLEAVKTMVAADPELLNRKNHRSTPLIFAIGNSKVRIAKYLINNGADVNAKSSRGKSPLELALGCSVDLADTILDRADLKLKYHEPLFINIGSLRSPDILYRMVEKFGMPLEQLLEFETYNRLVVLNIIKSPQEDKAVAAFEGDGVLETLLKALESFDGPSFPGDSLRIQEARLDVGGDLESLIELYEEHPEAFDEPLIVAKNREDYSGQFSDCGGNPIDLGFDERLSRGNSATEKRSLEDSGHISKKARFSEAKSVVYEEASTVFPSAEIVAINRDDYSGTVLDCTVNQTSVGNHQIVGVDTGWYLASVNSALTLFEK